MARATCGLVSVISAMFVESQQVRIRTVHPRYYKSSKDYINIATSADKCIFIRVQSTQPIGREKNHVRRYAHYVRSTNK